jgi:hypothetical protein
MHDTRQTIQHELDAVLAEGFALFTETIQGIHSNQALTFMNKRAPYYTWNPEMGNVSAYSRPSCPHRI